MRIAIVTPFAMGMGGVEVFSSILRGLLEDAGHSVEFVTADNRPVDGLFDRLAIKVVGLPWVTRKVFQSRAKEFDLVIANGEFAFGVDHPKVIQIFHGCYRGFLSHLKPSLSLRQKVNLERFARLQKHASKSRYVVAVSSFVKGILEADGIVVDRVVPNAVDTTKFVPKGDAEFRDRFLFIGSYNRFGKGFDILEALVSRGLKIDCITNQDPGSGLGWVRQVPHAQLPDILPKYGAFLFPSRFEGMALSPLEAMSCGLPVLTSQVGFGLELQADIPEMVFDWRSEPSLDAIEAKARFLMDNREALSVRSRELVVEKYGLSRFRETWLSLVEELESTPAVPSYSGRREMFLI